MTVVGVLGGGQLGQMLADAGHRLGMQVRLFDPSPDACGQRSAPLTVGSFDDIDAVRAFARGVDVVTYEFENIPVSTIEVLEAGGVAVRPGSGSLRVAQDRLAEKNAFTGIGLETPKYAAVSTEDDLQLAVARVGLPAVLKTRREGYDGKGQCVLRESDDPAAAWRSLGCKPCILEAFVPFARELSVVVARGEDGTVIPFATTQNEHRNGILYLSFAPVNEAGHAAALAQRLAASLEYVGVLALELFETHDGRLLGNEFAPRVHNSGHWTMNAGGVSQFEQHLRAIVGLPLMTPENPSGAAMINLVGRLPPQEALDLSDAAVHLYGKQARTGRKLGHINWVREDCESAATAARAWADRWLRASPCSSILPG